MFKKADYCLYIAKEKGRDRYVFFRDELHRKSYEESITRVQHVGTNGREIQELKAIAKFMSNVTENQALAYREILNRISWRPLIFIMEKIYQEFIQWGLNRTIRTMHSM